MAGDSQLQACLTFPPLSGLSLRTSRQYDPWDLHPERLPALLPLERQELSTGFVWVGVPMTLPRTHAWSILSGFIAFKKLRMGETLPWSPTPRHQRGSVNMCQWLPGSSTYRAMLSSHRRPKE